MQSTALRCAETLIGAIMLTLASACAKARRSKSRQIGLNSQRRSRWRSLAMTAMRWRRFSSDLQPAACTARHSSWMEIWRAH